MKHLQLERTRFSDVLVKNHYSLYITEEIQHQMYMLAMVCVCVSNYSEI